MFVARVKQYFFLHFADHPILQVLYERNDDKPAQDFSKKQKERVSTR